MNFHNFLLLDYFPSTAMETLKTPSEYSVDFNRGFQGFSMANLETGNVPFQRTMHLSSVIPANDTRESVFGLRNFPRRKWGSNLGPLAPEASALTTELPLYYCPCHSNQPTSVGRRSLQTRELVAFTIRHAFLSDIPHPLLHNIARSEQSSHTPGGSHQRL